MRCLRPMYLALGAFLAMTTLALSPAFDVTGFAGSARADDDDDDDVRAPRAIRQRGFWSPRQRIRRQEQVRRRVARPPVATRERAVAREIVLSGLTPAQLDRLRSEGFAVIAERDGMLVPGISARLRAPRRLSIERGLERARAIAPGAAIDRNHVFVQRFVTQGRRASRAPSYDRLALVDWRPQCRPRVTIGLIDTAVDLEHPGLRGRRIERISVRGPGYAPSRPEHGTALATLLYGDAVDAGLAPDAELIAADAFHRRNGQDVADAYDLAKGLDHVAQRGARVINLSLAGPENAVLDRAGRAARERGIRIVAAVGNDGPAAQPRYPAAFDWAIAVTAIDGERVAYGRAVRGQHVDLAAPGVALPMRTAQGAVVSRSGTSFATVFVTAALAALGEAGDPAGRLTAAALDLGDEGHDPVYGHGLLQVGSLCERSASRSDGAVLRRGQDTSHR